MTKSIRPKIKAQYVGTPANGRYLELYTEFDGMGRIVATILADELDESLWLEVEVNGRPVQVPLDLVKKAIESSATGVHSEQWYEKNVYSKNPA